MGRVQATGAGLGLGETPWFWSKASNKEWMEVMVAEVSRIEEKRYTIKAVSQCRQGSRKTWEGVFNHEINWIDLRKNTQARISVLIRATHGALPRPRDLHQCLGE